MSTLKDRLAASRKAIADNKASYDKAYKFAQGKTVLRLLPGVTDPDEFAKEFGVHYIKDLSSGNIIAVVGDASICYGKPCPVRDGIGQILDKFNSRGDEVNAKKVKEWLAKTSFVANVQVVGGADTENKGKVVRPQFSQTAMDTIMSIMEDFIEADPDFEAKFRERGLLLTVERTGTTKENTEYKYNAYPTQPDKPIPADVLAARVDLQSIVDGKFGQSVTTALQKLSVYLGKDLSQTALGSAIAQTQQLAAPNAPGASAPATETAPEEDDLTALLGGDDVPDAEFTDSTPAPATAPATQPAAAKSDDFDDILAEIDGL